MTCHSVAAQVLCNVPKALQPFKTSGTTRRTTQHHAFTSIIVRTTNLTIIDQLSKYRSQYIRTFCVLLVVWVIGQLLQISFKQQLITRDALHRAHHVMNYWEAPTLWHFLKIPMLVSVHDTQRQARELVLGSCLDVKARLLSLNRIQPRAVTDFLTGHNTLRRHLHLMGLSDSPLSRRCGAEDETSAHIL